MDLRKCSSFTVSEDTQSAFADRRFGTSFCISISDNAECKRMFQIGDRRMLIANFSWIPIFSAPTAARIDGWHMGGIELPLVTAKVVTTRLGN